MKKKVTVLLFVILLVSLLGLAIEVINPHSFLLTEGAFVRAFILLILMGVWIWFSKKNEKHLLISGSIILLHTACAYFAYGISSYCGNLYYEQTNHYQTVTQDYSCPRILKENLFGL